jgi:peptidoglycan hydrolase-like protein with peptidoglycan-binding domain
MKTRDPHHPAPKPGLTSTDKKDNAALATAVKSGSLAQGTSSKAVADLKHDLGVLGFHASSGDIFDASTAKALSEFQSAMGLPASGILDANSLHSLVNVETEARSNPGLAFAGMKMSRVRTMEKDLETLGYLQPSQVAGNEVFTKTDRADLEAARRADGSAYRGGALGAGGIAELKSDVQSLNHPAYRTRVEPSWEHTRNDAAVGKAVAKVNADGAVGVGEGDHGGVVATIQARLWAAGYDCKGDSGNFGARTQGAVEAFQRKNGLRVTGRVDSSTWAKLSKAYIYTKSDTSPAQALDEKDAAVERTQKMLQAVGEKHMPTSGLFDSKTAAAVKSFQRKNHLAATGTVNGETLAKLKKVAAADSNSRGLAKAVSIAKHAVELEQSSGCYDYTQDPGARTNYGLGPTTRQSDGRITFDCSGFVGAVYKAAGLKAPYTVGYTGTSFDVAGNPNMQKVSEQQAKPGDVVVFPDHIALYIGGGMCISMGQEGDPAIVSVAAEAAYHNRGIQGFYHLKGT